MLAVQPATELTLASFELPRETIDRLRTVGRRLLNEDPGFQALLKALNGATG